MSGRNCMRGILCDCETPCPNDTTTDYKAEEAALFPERYRDVD